MSAVLLQHYYDDDGDYSIWRGPAAAASSSEHSWLYIYIYYNLATVRCCSRCVLAPIPE